MHRRRSLRGSLLDGVGKLAGALLCPWESSPPADVGSQVIRHVSANRAKGLDSLAVVVVDFEPFSEHMDPDWQAAYFMACSRARQLLAIVATDPAAAPAS